MSHRSCAVRRASVAACLFAVASTLAGTGRALAQPPARMPLQASASCDPATPSQRYCGDGGPSAAARLAAPRDVAVAPDGDLLIADGLNSAVRQVRGDIISTAAGLGFFGAAAPRRPSSVADVALADPRGVAALPDGAFAIADAGLRAVLLVSRDGLVRTLLDRRGKGMPVDVAALDADTLVVTDATAGLVLQVDLDGATRTLARGLARP